MEKYFCMVLALSLLFFQTVQAEGNTEVLTPDFSKIVTYSEKLTADEQVYSCIWAGMLVRKNVTVDGYLSALDTIGLKYLKKTENYGEDGQQRFTTLWFTEVLCLALVGDPVRSASIIQYKGGKKPALGAEIPIDLERNYLTLVLGERE